MLLWWRETPQTAICCLEWLGRLKCLATGLDAFWSIVFLYITNRSPSRLPMQNMSFHSQRWENIGTQAINQAHWSFHLYLSQCHLLHNLHFLQKFIHRRNRGGGVGRGVEIAFYRKKALLPIKRKCNDHFTLPSLPRLKTGPTSRLRPPEQAPGEHDFFPTSPGACPLVTQLETSITSQFTPALGPLARILVNEQQRLIQNYHGISLTVRTLQSFHISLCKICEHVNARY